MALSKRAQISLRVLMVITSLTAIAAGALIGLTIATTQNLGNFESFDAARTAIATQIFDIKGRFITEFFAREKRDPIKLNELPPHLVYALITREDQDFFNHPGFSIKGISRAVYGQIIGSNLGGGSTITQQLAGELYADRADKSILRKLRELWYAIQIEQHWTKQQIIEEYMNRMFFGHGTYGVDAASKFYFGHSAKEITVAESAILVLQLSGTNIYSILRYPDRARARQRYVLDNMVKLGYVSPQEADSSFEEYWANYDVTRSADETAFFERVDHAPYFSEYIRSQLETILLGESDIYRDGYKVYTTLNLDHQAEAQKLMSASLLQANQTFRRNHSGKSLAGAEVLVPIVDLLSLTFDLPELRVADKKQLRDAKAYYRNILNPLVDVVGLQFSSPGNATLLQASAASRKESELIMKQRVVEGALITLDNETGYITAMVGGSKFEARNAANRATQGRVQPGSTFKPLYYAAGIESGVVTPATQFYDSPVTFDNPDGSIYAPKNYGGWWHGPVLVRAALNQSLNIPSIKLLNTVGFTDAINISSSLMGIPQDQLINRGFRRVYSLGLGVVSISPLELARGFSAFPRQGKAVGEISIRYIQDSNNKVIVEQEKLTRQELSDNGRYRQVISPQTAYIMTDMLRTSITRGTLFNPVKKVGGLPMVMGGKTGTTQNWSSAWTVGFSPYYTTAIWMGFDEGASTNSLGTNQSGETLVAPVWAQYMKTIHQNLPVKEFVKPGGLVQIAITEKNGLLPPPDYQGKVLLELFKYGTEPREIDTDNGVPEQVNPEQFPTGVIITPLGPDDILTVDPEVQAWLDAASSLTDPNAPKPGDGYNEPLN